MSCIYTIAPQVKEKEIIIGVENSVVRVWRTGVPRIGQFDQSRRILALTVGY